MSGETCRDCANRGEDPNAYHITYCYAWGQKICNVLEGNEDFRHYYDLGYDNGCPHYASGPQRFRKKSGATGSSSRPEKKKSKKSWIFFAVIAVVLWFLSR